MARSRFDPFNSFLRRYHKLIIVAWIIAVIVAGSQISVFFSHVSYNVAGSNFGGPTNSESQQAQNIINAQFPRSVNSSDNGIIVVIQSSPVYSSSVESAVLAFNQTVATDHTLAKNFTGLSSVYSTEYSFLASVMPSLVAQVSQLNSSVAAMAPAGHPLTAAAVVGRRVATRRQRQRLLVLRLPALQGQRGPDGRLPLILGLGDRRLPGPRRGARRRGERVLHRLPARALPLPDEQLRQPRQQHDDRDLQLRGRAQPRHDSRLQVRHRELGDPRVGHLLRDRRRGAHAGHLEGVRACPRDNRRPGRPRGARDSRGAPPGAACRNRARHRRRDRDSDRPPHHLLRRHDPRPRHAHVPHARADDPAHPGARHRLLRPPAQEDEGGEVERQVNRGQRLDVGPVGGSGGAHRGDNRGGRLHRDGGGQRPALQRRGHLDRDRRLDPHPRRPDAPPVARASAQGPPLLARAQQDASWSSARSVPG